jgi:glycosyltransferase involved in cell wall biosynthesis
LARMLRRRRPTAIVCWMYHAMAVGTLAQKISGVNVPVFWNVRQSLDDPTSLSSSTRIALKLTRLLSAMPAGIVYNSARALDLHRRFGFRNANSQVIPNGFELPSPAPARHAADVLGIAARLHPQKDHATFFAAAAATRRSHPSARFIAAGAGLTPDNIELRRMIEASGLPMDAVELRGEVADMASFYRDIDAIVLSSRTEGFPNVIGEAMSYGRPAVSTDVGDAAAIIGSTGFVVPPGDPIALAEAMGRMLAMPAEGYAALSTAARKRIEQHYSLGRVVQLYDDFVGRSAA